MTRSPEQRLDTVEDELETAKRLLVSAASYAESANLGLERLTERQDRTQAQLDRLTERQDRTQAQLDQLSERQDATTVQLDRLTVTVENISTHVDELTTAQAQTQATLGELTTAQTQTQRQLTELTGKVDQVSNRVDEFVFQAQRLFTQGGGRLNNAEGRIERLEAIILRLDRNYEANLAQFQEFQRTTNAALERIDRILDYLLRQLGG